jgi:hypothetical protein
MKVLGLIPTPQKKPTTKTKTMHTSYGHSQWTKQKDTPRVEQELLVRHIPHSPNLRVGRNGRGVLPKKCPAV